MRWTPYRKQYVLANYLRASREERKALLEANEISREEIESWSRNFSERGTLGLMVTQRKRKQ